MGISRDDFLGCTDGICAMDALSAGDEGMCLDMQDACGDRDPVSGPTIRITTRLFELCADGNYLALASSCQDAKGLEPIALLTFQLVNGRMPPEIGTPDSTAIQIVLGASEDS